jgi:hypothetical protein
MRECTRPDRSRRLAAAAVVGLTALAAGSALAQKSPILRPRPLPPEVSPRVQPAQCGGYTGIYGPMDFRTAHPDDRRVVEAYHLDMEMQIFLSGRVEGTHRAGSGPIAGGFIYTLRAIPNHPVAMLLIEQLGRRLRSERPQNIEWPLECVYVRAFMLTPDDPIVRAMYGTYLAHRGRNDEAARFLDEADPALRRSPAMQFQIGLANLQLKRYEQAQLNAMRAEANGYTVPGLRDQLQAAGRWKPDLVLPPEPPEADAAAPAASAASAASPS